MSYTMTITFRNYNASADFKLIGSFLIENYQPDNRDGNWFQPTWEYMHSHPFLDESALDKIGVWEDAGEVEPVATDPDFRRRGLGKAAVLEGIRRCGALGATVAFVGSDLEFYKAIGFRKIYTSRCWMKYIEA